jgi:peroxiredoxin
MSETIQNMTRRAVIATASSAIALAQRKDDINQLPPNLPVPLDDGACDHLPGLTLPSIQLTTTRNRMLDVSKVVSPRVIVYIYPRTGQPNAPVPEGWDAIPGARGCTPQSCSMRDHYKEMKSLGTEVFGLSAQSTEYQQEMAERLHLPFEVLSDNALAFTRALKLPTFQTSGMTLNKRLTLVVRDHRIEKVFYPVFPTDQHGQQMVDWLKFKNRQPA